MSMNGIARWAILVAAFWDAPDFICIPAPKPFVFYADHDDWITFYANTKSHLNHIIEPLSSHGYTLFRIGKESSNAPTNAGWPALFHLGGVRRRPGG